MEADYPENGGLIPRLITLALAGRYASAVIGAAFSIEEAIEHRSAFRSAAEAAGRNPDEIKFIPGLMTTIATDKRTALDRRIALTEWAFPQRLAYLQQMIGVRIDPADLAKPFSPEQLAKARPSNQDPRSVRALMIAREGWSLRDILAHGVIDFQPVVAGTAKEVADHMQAWFEAGAADGFWISPDVMKMASMPLSTALCRYFKSVGFFTKTMKARRFATTSERQINMG